MWDPFDKHLASLMANNEVVVYKCASWERSHTINLNLNPQKPLKYYAAKREDRKIDWSPDFRYLGADLRQLNNAACVASTVITTSRQIYFLE